MLFDRPDSDWTSSIGSQSGPNVFCTIFQALACGGETCRSYLIEKARADRRSIFAARLEDSSGKSASRKRSALFWNLDNSTHAMRRHARKYHFRNRIVRAHTGYDPDATKVWKLSSSVGNLRNNGDVSMCRTTLALENRGKNRGKNYPQ